MPIEKFQQLEDWYCEDYNAFHDFVMTGDPAISDCNGDEVVNGFYQVAYNAANRPITANAAGRLICFGTGTLGKTQIFIVTNGAPAAYIRKYGPEAGGVNRWSEWLPLTFPEGVWKQPIQTYYVDRSAGVDTDNWIGDSDNPFKTIDHAMTAASRSGHNNLYLKLVTAGSYPCSLGTLAGISMHITGIPASRAAVLEPEDHMVLYNVHCKLTNITVDNQDGGSMYSDGGDINYNNVTFVQPVAVHGGSCVMDGVTTPRILVNRGNIQMNDLVLGGNTDPDIHYALQLRSTTGYLDGTLEFYGLDQYTGAIYANACTLYFNNSSSQISVSDSSIAPVGIYLVNSAVSSTNAVKTDMASLGTTPISQGSPAVSRWYTDSNIS